MPAQHGSRRMAWWLLQMAEGVILLVGAFSLMKASGTVMLIATNSDPAQIGVTPADMVWMGVFQFVAAIMLIYGVGKCAVFLALLAAWAEQHTPSRTDKGNSPRS